MSNAAQFTASMEDYLEAVYRVQWDKRVAGVKEIGAQLQVKMPNISLVSSPQVTRVVMRRNNTQIRQ